MATKLEAFPTKTGTKYDWDTFFNGDVWKLVEGEDFNVPMQSFRGALGAAKKARGLEVKTAKQTEDGKTFLVIQAVGKVEAPVAAPAAKAKTPAKKAVPAKKTAAPASAK